MSGPSVAIEATTTVIVGSRWRNHAEPLDVNNNRLITSSDALLVINFLNSDQPRFLPNVNLDPPPYLDVTGDKLVSPSDALLVINFLNQRSSGLEGEGEHSLPNRSGKLRTLPLADLPPRFMEWNSTTITSVFHELTIRRETLIGFRFVGSNEFATKAENTG